MGAYCETVYGLESKERLQKNFPWGLDEVSCLSFRQNTGQLRQNLHLLFRQPYVIACISRSIDPHVISLVPLN